MAILDYRSLKPPAGISSLCVLDGDDESCNIARSALGGAIAVRADRVPMAGEAVGIPLRDRLRAELLALRHYLCGRAVFLIGNAANRRFDRYTPVLTRAAAGEILRRPLRFIPQPASNAEIEVSDWEEWVGLEKLATGRALEIGCGSGRLLRRLSARGWTGAGFDLRAFPEWGNIPGFEFYLARAEKFPFIADASIDLLISNLVHCYLEDEQAVFSEMTRVVRPGGILSLSTPNRENLKTMWRSKPILEFPGLCKYHTLEEIRGQAERNGFEILKHRFQGFTPPYFSRSIRLIGGLVSYKFFWTAKWLPERLRSVVWILARRK